MYQYPFLLLTQDDVRNSAIADMFDDEMTDSADMKKKLYALLPDDAPIRALYDLLDMEVTITKMFCDVFRSNMAVFNKQLHDMDTWRIKERLKRTLTIMRRKSGDVLHKFDHYAFADSLHKQDLWEDSPTKKRSSPIDWNGNFLNRVSDIHRHVSRGIAAVEPRLMLQTCQLKSQSEDATSDPNNPKTSEVNADYMDYVSRIPVMLEAMRTIHREVKDYVRLVDSL